MPTCASACNFFFLSHPYTIIHASCITPRAQDKELPSHGFLTGHRSVTADATTTVDSSQSMYFSPPHSSLPTFIFLLLLFLLLLFSLLCTLAATIKRNQMCDNASPSSPRARIRSFVVISVSYHRLYIYIYRFARTGFSIILKPLSFGIRRCCLLLWLYIVYNNIIFV